MAKLDVPSVRNLYDAVIADYESRTGQRTPLLKVALVRGIAWAFSGLVVLNYRQGQWVYLQMFIDTCDFDALTKYGEEVGVIFKTSSNTVAEVRLGGVTAGSIPAGAVFVGPRGATYRTIVSTPVVSGTAICSVTAYQPGAGSTLAVGETVTVGSPLVGIPNTGTVSSVSVEGEDAETEAEYRDRVKIRYRLSPQGGAPADYYLWGTEVEGIVDILVYLINPGVTSLYVVETGSGIERQPSGVKLAEVETAIRKSPDSAVYDRHPIQSILNVQAPTFKEYDITVSGLDSVANTNQNRASIKTALVNYLDTRKPEVPSLAYPASDAIISESDVSARITDVLSVSENSGVFNTVSLEVDGVPVAGRDLLWVGELANLGTLTINGVQVV